MSAPECFWRMNNGPTMGEIYARAELIAQALELTYAEWALPVDRASIVIRNPEVREIALILPREMKDGHWVHVEPHSAECPDK